MTSLTLSELQHILIILNGCDPYCEMCSEIRHKLESAIAELKGEMNGP